VVAVGELATARRGAASVGARPGPDFGALSAWTEAAGARRKRGTVAAATWAAAGTTFRALLSTGWLVPKAGRESLFAAPTADVPE